MNKAKLQAINGFMALKGNEKMEVLRFLNDLIKKPLLEQLYEEEMLLEKLIKLDS